VTGPRDDRDEPLKNAFRALADTTADECSDVEIDRIWRAASGELDADARRDLVDRMAASPAAAEAWRVAQAMREAQGYPAVPAVESRHSWSPTWMGLAAALVVTVGLGLFQLNRATTQPADVYRDQAASPAPVESLVPSDSTLPRDAFLLRWSPGPTGSRYQLRVTTDDLRVLTTVADVNTPELTIPAAALESVAPGARVLWQVVTTLPSGQTVSSPTFVVRVP
jgi:hypothetical protein